MMEVICSSEKSDLTTVIRRHIPEDDILHAYILVHIYALLYRIHTQKTNSVAFNPKANCTDRTTAAAGVVNVDFCGYRLSRGQCS
jgi:hypothetical protein